MPRLGFVVIAALPALACGGALHDAPGTPPAPPVTMQAFAPLAARAEARRPDRAVIPGADAADRWAVLPLPGVGRAELDALVVRTAGGVPAGATAHVAIAVTPSAGRGGLVQIADGAPGGASAAARAATWTAVLVACEALDKDPAAYAIAVSSAGPLDGSTAPALAAGLLAALTGAPVDPHVAIAGTLEPDGAIGPADELPERVLAAIAAGKQRIGIPAGQRHARGATGPAIDVGQLAKDHGAEVIELGDVHDAYRLLTGRTLPAPVPLAEAELALDGGERQRLDGRYKAWQQQLATEWATVVQLDSAGRQAPLLAALRGAAEDSAKTAEELRKRGELAPAYAKILAAWAYAASTTVTSEVVAKAQAGDLEGAKAVLAQFATRGRSVHDALATIGATPPTTVAADVAMAASFKTALEGWAYGQRAQEAMEAATAAIDALGSKTAAELGAPATADALAAAVAPAVVYTARRAVGASLAEEELALGTPAGPPYTCAVADLAQDVTAHQAAAAAGADAFDALLQALAAEAGVTPEVGRERLASAEPDYVVASHAIRLADGGGVTGAMRADEWGEHSLPWTLLLLAGSELAYVDTAGLVAKYAALGIHARGSEIASLDEEPAFRALLGAAEAHARATARQARAASGAIPLQARLAYQLARHEQTGSLGDQLDALGEYWASAAISELAVTLARN